MEFSIQYGESTLHRCQYSEQFEVMVDPVASVDRDRLTIVSKVPVLDVIEFTIETDPYTDYR
jgi:hypothetical protein